VNLGKTPARSSPGVGYGRLAETEEDNIGDGLDEFAPIAGLTLSRPLASGSVIGFGVHEPSCTNRIGKWLPAIKKRRRSAISSPGNARSDYQPHRLRGQEEGDQTVTPINLPTP
jgi:hypothetical protein